MRSSPHYESDTAFDNKTYRMRGYNGIAFYVLGWQTEPDEDTEWSGIENRTGSLLAVVVGDDHKYIVEPDDLTELDEAEFCNGCGQFGCGHGTKRE